MPPKPIEMCNELHVRKHTRVGSRVRKRAKLGRCDGGVLLDAFPIVVNLAVTHLALVTVAGTVFDLGDVNHNTGTVALKLNVMGHEVLEGASVRKRALVLKDDRVEYAPGEPRHVAHAIVYIVVADERTKRVPLCTTG